MTVIMVSIEKVFNITVDNVDNSVVDDIMIKCKSVSKTVRNKLNLVIFYTQT